MEWSSSNQPALHRVMARALCYPYLLLNDLSPRVQNPAKQVRRSQHYGTGTSTILRSLEEVGFTSGKFYDIGC